MAKKKLSAREKRELEKQAKNQRWRARADAREAAAQAEADKKRREEMDARWTQAKKDSPQAQSKKTRTKAAGLKSVFLLSDNKLIMTSFQQGNSARVEYQVVERRAELLVKQPVFRVDNKRKAAKQEPFVIHGRNYIDAYRDDPRPAQSDLIGCKSALENQYYREAVFPKSCACSDAAPKPASKRTGRKKQKKPLSLTRWSMAAAFFC